LKNIDADEEAGGAENPEHVANMELEGSGDSDSEDETGIEQYYEGEDDNEYIYRRKIEGPMREVAETQDCRRDVTDKYYGNMVHARGMKNI
jgi:hypothetical protein